MRLPEFSAASSEPSRTPRIWRRALAALAGVSSLALVAGGLLFGAVPANAAVPADSAAQAVITVKTGGVRTGVNTVGNLQGVKLELVRDSAGDTQGSPTGAPVATCDSDADGDCSFVVPAALLDTTANRQFWIRQAASFVPGSNAATNYLSNPVLVTGLDNGNFQATDYQFYISNVQPDHTYVSGVDFMQLTNNSRSASAGIWQDSYKNPAAQAQCGLKIALLSDLSSSVNATALGQLKDAAVGFVEALQGTPSTVSLYTFGTTAPAPNTSGTNNATLLDVSTLGNVSALTTKINSYAVPGSSYTNWDAGLWQLQGLGYDQIIVITDGNPTAYSINSTTDGVDTRFNEIERAVFSANLLKSQGSRIVTVGIGTAMLGGQNLKAISGPVVGSDFFSGSWDDLANTLHQIAAENCAGSVTVVKKVIPWNGSIANAAPAGGWVFDASAGPAGVDLDKPLGTTAAVTGAVNFQLDDIPVAAGATFTAAEQLQPGYVAVPVAAKNAVCTKNGGTGVTVTNGTGLEFTVPVGANDVVNCTVYNKEPQPNATVTVNKQWVVNTVAQPLNTFPAGYAATLTGTSTTWGSAKQIPVGTVTVGETGVTVPSDYCTLVSQKVTAFNGSPLDVNIASGSYTTPNALAAGSSNTITVTNAVTCVGKLKLVKVVVNDNGGTATSADWTLKYGSTGVTSGTTSVVTPGAYALTEVGLAGSAGYAPSATVPLVCSQGLAGTTVTVPASTTVTCTFTNDDIAPTLRLVKQVVGAPGVAASNWTLTAKDGGTTAVSGAGDTGAVAVKAGINYSLAETAGGGVNPADFDASSWTCLAGTAPVAVTAGVLAKLTPGQNVVCTITNTAKGVDPTITKTANPPAQNPDGTWTITYTVTVTNPSKYAGITYNLSDTLAFGGSIAVNSSSATLAAVPVAGWNGTSNTTLASGIALAAEASHVYTITVVASVPNGETATACPASTGKGGFMNRAVLTVAGKDYPAEACKTPSKPSFQKDAGTATSNADGTWTVTYVLKATNASGTNLYYDLTDDPQAGFPAGVTVLSGTVTPGGAYPGYASSWNPVTGGSKNTVVVNDLGILANTTQNFTISLVLGIAPSVTPSTLDCAVTGKGLVNTATLVSGNQVITDPACVSIVPPAVTHTKTLTSVNQLPDGNWSVTYEIGVTATGSGSTTYNLSDAPALGAGITLVSGSAAGPAQAASWTGSGALATAEPIKAGETDEYIVTVIASVAADVVGTDAADCTLQPLESGTGFLNVATLVVNGATSTAQDCGSPAKPEVDKQWVSTVQNPDSSWNVTFTLTVNNQGSKADLYYDLTDAPGFLSGVTVTGRTVAFDGGAPTSWNGTSPLATARLLPGDTVSVDSSDTYVLVFTVTVPLNLDPSTLTCAAAGVGHGFFNSATVTSGNQTDSDQDCGPVEEGVLPLVVKDVKPGFPRQIAGGDWEIAYDMTVSTPDGNTLSAVYDLSDTLEFGDGIQVVDSAVTGPGLATPNAWDGETVTTVATGVTLPAAATHVYTVTVTARLDAGVVLTDAADCTLDGVETGTGFLNTVVLTSGGLERTDDACASPAAPELTKDLFGTPVKGADGKITVKYTVTAKNPSALTLNYDLDDALGFADYVIINSATIQSTDATVNPAWNGKTTTRVVTGQSLPAGASDVYTVTVVASPTLLVEDDKLACKPATPGHGFFNGAVLTSGADEYEDDACAPILRSDLPTLPFDLAFTGTAFTGTIAGGLALLLAGGILFAFRSRRRPKH